MKRVIGGIIGVLLLFIILPLVKSFVTARKMRKLQELASRKPGLFVRYIDTAQPFWEGTYTPRQGAMIQMKLNNRPFWLIYSGPRNIHGSVSALLEDYQCFLKIKKSNRANSKSTSIDYSDRFPPADSVISYESTVYLTIGSGENRHPKHVHSTKKYTVVGRDKNQIVLRDQSDRIKIMTGDEFTSFIDTYNPTIEKPKDVLSEPTLFENL